MLSYKIGAKALGVILNGSEWVIIELEDRVNSEKEFVYELIKSVQGRKSKVSVYYNGEKIINMIMKKQGLKPIILVEDGLDISKASICNFENQIILLGTHVDPPDDIIALFRRYGAIEISIGPLSLFTSHSILYYSWAHTRRCIK